MVKIMGAFICTISERDWETARKMGVYGNRLYKEGTNNRLKDNQILSIIRDLISMKEGDLIFFHIRGRQTIHGIYEVSRPPFYEENRIWSDSIEIFPFRFLFKPHSRYGYLAQYDANIEVHSLYEYIDEREIKSLVTLENERNIEARGVRRILKEDAEILIKLLHRDFKLRKSPNKCAFSLYNPQNPKPLKNLVYRVGEIENAIKAVIMYNLSHDISFIRLLFDDEKISTPNEIDFANEFFIAQTTRKSIDIYCRSRNKHVLIEVKTDKIDASALRQVLYYRDLIAQRSWVNPENERIDIVLVGKRFSSDLLSEISKLNEISNGVRLMKYTPINEGTWGQFEYVH